MKKFDVYEWFVVDEWGRDKEICHDTTGDCSCFNYDSCENCPFYEKNLKK